MGKGRRKGWKNKQNKSDSHNTKMPDKPYTEVAKSQPKKEVPQILAWSRSISLISIFGGGFGVIQPSLFWIGAVFVYLGFSLLATDLFFEPQLRHKFKMIGWVIIVVMMAAFSRFVVFVPAPLGLGATVTAAEFPAGITIGGIQWKPFYTELVFLINNPTDNSYDDLDLLLQPDHPVAAIGQVSGLSGVSFQDRYALDLNMSMDESVISLVFVATNAGYKVHCGRIPAQAALRVIMAVVELKPGMSNPAQSNLPRDLLDPTASTYVARTRITEGKDDFLYWWAHLGNEGFYDKRPLPKSVKVSGHYTASNRRRSINNVILIRY